MSKATVRPGQTLEDIAVEYLGDEQGVFELVNLNGLAITDDLTAGQELTLPDVLDKRVRRVFEQGRYHPAVGDDSEEEGIDFWIIEQNFVVS